MQSEESSVGKALGWSGKLCWHFVAKAITIPGIKFPWNRFAVAEDINIKYSKSRLFLSVLTLQLTENNDMWAPTSRSSTLMSKSWLTVITFEISHYLNSSQNIFAWQCLTHWLVATSMHRLLMTHFNFLIFLCSPWNQFKHIHFGLLDYRNAIIFFVKGTRKFK